MFVPNISIAIPFHKYTAPSTVQYMISLMYLQMKEDYWMMRKFCLYNLTGAKMSGKEDFFLNKRYMLLYVMVMVKLAGPMCQSPLKFDVGY